MLYIVTTKSGQNRGGENMSKIKVDFNTSDDVKYHLTSEQNVIIIMALRDSIKFYKDKPFHEDFIQDVKEILNVLEDTKSYNYSNSNK